ncbi:hypothetical protein EYF80_015877 [Liparis tanakae]|uniref:Uncharacterized protein n=1 Tax=Liparis tanakae TaxID=230148 RepID=A0A4Z2I7P2_9TELE|nr:hypothetical protein EYF80_015877 [Liparis tanakae]
MKSITATVLTSVRTALLRQPDSDSDSDLCCRGSTPGSERSGGAASQCNGAASRTTLTPRWAEGKLMLQDHLFPMESLRADIMLSLLLIMSLELDEDRGAGHL